MSQLLQLWKRKFRKGKKLMCSSYTTIVLLTLVCLVSETELVPLGRASYGSPANPTETELLLDPIHQEEIQGLEPKTVVAKSIVNTVLITSPPNVPACGPGTQQVTPGGPCRKITSGVVVDEQLYLDQLRQLTKQGVILNHSNKRVRNRNCSTLGESKRNCSKNKAKKRRNKKPTGYLETAVIYEGVFLFFN